MKKFYNFVFFLMFVPDVFGGNFSRLFAFEIKSFDVVAFSLNCYACSAIENSTHSDVSHIGIILKNLTDQKYYFLESRGVVKVTTLAELNKIKRKGTKFKILRPLFEKSVDELQLISSMWDIFNLKYLNRYYDHDFLWDNVDAFNNEKYYCSEFVSKFLDEFFINKTQLYPMHFDEDKSFWINYFKLGVPEGLPGVSPADFFKDSRFTYLGSVDEFN